MEPPDSEVRPTTTPSAAHPGGDHDHAFATKPFGGSRLSDDRAFALLTRLSQHRNVKLRLVAEEIVAGGEIAPVK